MVADPLAVWLNDHLVGHLVRDRRGGFRFDARDGASSLTVSPLGAETPWGKAFSRNWFEGLLPEEGQRTTAEGNHGVARGDTFGLLAAIGWECAGAVSVLPEGMTPASGRYEPLTSAQVLERLDALPRLVDLVDQSVRLSLGGAQDKLMLRQTLEGWSLPLDGALSTHIFKPESPAYPGLAVAEAWCLTAAAAATATVTAHLQAPAGHRPTLVVERYDRTITGDGIVRTHQEDMCQVLGLSPADKYANSAKPREPQMARLAQILLNRSDDPSQELRRLLEQLTVNIALGNADAHAKNYSLVHGEGVVTLSPLYDVSPTMAFLVSQDRAALPVAGKFRLEDISRGHLLAEARTWRIPEPVAWETISTTLERLEQGMSAAQGTYEDLPPAVHSHIEIQFERLARSDW